MDDKEIMKQFEETFGLEKKEPAPTYKATRNLNTEIGNPNINVNDNMNINIINESVLEEKAKIDNLSNDLTNAFNNVDNSVNNSNQIMDIKKDSLSDKPVIYELPKDDNVSNKQTNVFKPTFKGKKKTKFKLSPELLICLIIVFVLFVFILIMPSISEFFRDVKSGFR